MAISQGKYHRLVFHLVDFACTTFLAVDSRSGANALIDTSVVAQSLACFPRLGQRREHITDNGSLA